MQGMLTPKEIIDSARTQAPDRRSIVRLGAVAGACAFMLLVAYDSFYTIQPSELGNVRRFGTVLYPRDQSVEPGLHSSFRSSIRLTGFKSRSRPFIFRDT